VGCDYYLDKIALYFSFGKVIGIDVASAFCFSNYKVYYR